MSLFNMRNVCFMLTFLLVISIVGNVVAGPPAIKPGNKHVGGPTLPSK